MNTWNLKKLYKSDDDPQIELDISTSEKRIHTFVKKWKTNKAYLKDPKVLKEALEEYQTVYKEISKALYYIILRQAQDQTNTKIKEKYNQITNIATKLENKLVFFELNIAKISKDKQKEFFSSSHLKDYKHYLEQSFKVAKYTLSEKEEKVFNLLDKTSHGNWVNMLDELFNKQSLEVLNENGKKEKITYNEISKYFRSTDKEVRDYASKEFNKVNKKYSEIAEFEINSLLENKMNSDEYRGISRPDLTRHLSDDLDSEVVDTLVKVVTDNFHISQKHYKLKAKLLGQRKLGYHERNVPVGNYVKEFEYEESLDIVKKVFKKLDQGFFDIVTMFEKNGNYDTHPKKGKRGGAFCISFNKDLPTYILLNHNDKLSDVLTIAHESGHGIHAELSKVQNHINAGHPTSLAEVASTFFEDFVLQDILETSKDPKFKEGLLMEKMDQDVSTIFRQVAFYNFEKELHKDFRKKGFLSKEYISDLFCKHMQSYLGDAVEVDDGMRNGWLYVSHFRSFFYVYSYASGLLISKGLQSLVRKDKENIKKVKEFLRSGSSLSPKDVFKKIGIDITDEEFWKKGLEDIEKTLETACSN